MGTVHIVFGPQGAGKSTYARRLADEVNGVRFSIDDWMQQLYGPDLPRPLSLPWIMERVGRCEARIWATAAAIAGCGGAPVLDLGFMQIAQRTAVMEKAAALGLPTRLHFIDAPHALRRQRVLDRNTDRGETFSFAVTPAMFDAMEARFERPTAAELAAATVATTA